MHEFHICWRMARPGVLCIVHRHWNIWDLLVGEGPFIPKLLPVVMSSLTDLFRCGVGEQMHWKWRLDTKTRYQVHRIG